MHPCMLHTKFRNVWSSFNENWCGMEKSESEQKGKKWKKSLHFCCCCHSFCMLCYHIGFSYMMCDGERKIKNWKIETSESEREWLLMTVNGWFSVSILIHSFIYLYSVEADLHREYSVTFKTTWKTKSNSGPE